MTSVEGVLSRQLAFSRSQLEELESQITPWEHDRSRVQTRANPLGILPSLLGQMKGLKQLFIRLSTWENIDEVFRFDEPQGWSQAYYTYIQVFPPSTQ